MLSHVVYFFYSACISNKDQQDLIVELAAPLEIITKLYWPPGQLLFKMIDWHGLLLLRCQNICHKNKEFGQLLNQPTYRLVRPKKLRVY